MKMFQSHVVVLIAGLFALQMAIVCLVLRRSPGMDRSGLTSFALGDLAAALGACLLAAQGFWPDRVSAGAADLALLLALSAMVRGTRHFVAAPGRVLALVVLNLAAGALVIPGALPPSMTLVPLPMHWIVVVLAGCLAALLLDLAISIGPLLPTQRGTGRLAALSLVMIALTSAGINAWVVAGPLVELVDGKPLPILETTVPYGALTILNVFAVVGLSVSFALMAHDRLRRMLERRARHDDLTDVLSRGAFWEELEAACTNAERQRQPLTVAFVDLDHFKAINDVYGHMAGDSVLRHFAGLLRKTSGLNDIIGRLGGEEFAIVMPDTTLESGRAASIRLNTAVRAAPCPSEPDAISYTVSIGMALRQPGEDADTLMRRADRALYDAKLKGRNCVSMHSAGQEVQEGGVAKFVTRQRQRLAS